MSTGVLFSCSYLLCSCCDVLLVWGQSTGFLACGCVVLLLLGGLNVGLLQFVIRFCYGMFLVGFCRILWLELLLAAVVAPGVSSSGFQVNGLVSWSVCCAGLATAGLLAGRGRWALVLDLLYSVCRRWFEISAGVLDVYS